MEHRPYAGDPGLSVLFGDAAVEDELRAIDLALRDWAEALRRRSPGPWSAPGLQIADYPGPPRAVFLEAYLEGPVSFIFGIRPEPGGLYVEGEVYVDPPPSAPRSDPMWLVFSVPETERASPHTAVAALAEAVARVREESERRALTPDAWW